MNDVLDTPTGLKTAPRRQRLPHLRLVERREPMVDALGPREGRGHAPLPSLSSASTGGVERSRGAYVLVAGADARTRGRMLEELRSLLPDGTPFAEAAVTWEVIARAADSSMVVLVGDLGDVSAASLMRTLARREPLLPVLAVGEDRRPRRRPRPSAGGEPGACQPVDTLSA